MNVLFLSHQLHGGGGLEQCELRIARGLAGRGWAVQNAHAVAGDLADCWDEFACLETADGAITDEFVAAAIERADPDTIYVHSVDLLPVAVRAAAPHRIPVVSHLHLPPFHVRHGLRAHLRGRFREPLDPAVFGSGSQVARFLAVSSYLRQSWIDGGLPGDRVAVVHNGVPLDEFTPLAVDDRVRLRQTLGITDDAVALIFVGRIDPSKGVDLLLDAFRTVSKRSAHRLVLLMCGAPSQFRGSEGQNYLDKVKRDAPPGVQWLGNRTDVATLMAAADIAVVPSEWEEPFGLVAAEAMAVGTTVVATRRGGLPEVLVGELAANLVDGGARQLAARLMSLIDNRSERCHYSNIGRTTCAEKFSEARMVAEVDAHLREVTDGR